jgi:gelsolin
MTLRGGVATGFHHVTETPPLELHKLYLIKLYKAGTKNTLVVREVPATAASIIEGDVYILDKGTQVLQFNTKASAGQEKFKAAEFAQSLIAPRKGQCDVTVFGTASSVALVPVSDQELSLDEGGSGAGKFLAEFGEATRVSPAHAAAQSAPPKLFRLSDASGKVTFEPVQSVSRASLRSEDAFLLDDSHDSAYPVIYVWLGKDASLTEKRLAPQYAQRYLYETAGDNPATSIVKVGEGNESSAFLNAFTA